MILIINTAVEDIFQIALADKDGVLLAQKNVRGKYVQAEKLLPTIVKLMEVNKIKQKDLKGIVVVKGPGGFTSIRIGVITANTFSFALNLPIIDFKLNEFSDFGDLAKKSVRKFRKKVNKKLVIPFYGREPNITKSNKNIFDSLKI
ncbi:MAG: tRNA (adenosine(37)-N6)-threonylcarbamoyltransferase complex dimerization subunit type 1 TsaB [Candidatus Kerfeldbacteria bacterium]|jgi:tRNA threonylcarbamoyl adenosine modification protein YeaZ